MIQLREQTVATVVSARPAECTGRDTSGSAWDLSVGRNESESSVRARTQVVVERLHEHELVAIMHSVGFARPAIEELGSGPNPSEEIYSDTIKLLSVDDTLIGEIKTDNESDINSTQRFADERERVTPGLPECWTNGEMSIVYWWFEPGKGWTKTGLSFHFDTYAELLAFDLHGISLSFKTVW